MTKELKDKAISIHGKGYVLVSDRVLHFNEKYPDGAIITKLLSNPTAEMVVVHAKVVPDVSKPERWFTGLSQAKWGDGIINKTSALENAETSAVGRALGMMGIGVIESIASADEMNKASSYQQSSSQSKVTTGNVHQYAQHKNEINSGKCEKCGAPLALSKAGNYYCSAKCWLPPKGGNQ